MRISNDVLNDTISLKNSFNLNCYDDSDDNIIKGYIQDINADPYGFLLFSRIQVFRFIVKSKFDKIFFQITIFILNYKALYMERHKRQFSSLELRCNWENYKEYWKGCHVFVFNCHA